MGVVIIEGEGAVLGVNLGCPIVTNGDVVVCLFMRDVLFPNYFGEDLLCDWLLVGSVVTVQPATSRGRMFQTVAV